MGSLLLPYSLHCKEEYGTVTFGRRHSDGAELCLCKAIASFVDQTELLKGPRACTNDSIETRLTPWSGPEPVALNCLHRFSTCFSRSNI